MRIQNKLFRQWRICATGLAFITFMVGSVFFVFAIIPTIRLLPISAEDKRSKILYLLHWSFKLFIKYTIRLKIIDVFEVEGLEDIKCTNSYIFIANHPTLIDVVAIMSCVPFCNCIIRNLF